MSLKMKLADLIKLHDQDSTDPALKNSLGDYFLYKNNILFKNIRNQFLNLGFQYTDKDFCHYAVLPYASLPQILKHKKVPYFDNVSVLREIEKEHPLQFTCEELVKVKSNYTLHESSHCVADYYLKQISQSKKLQFNFRYPDCKKAFFLVMAESFANTVESMANVYNTTAEQRLCYELNSYVTHNKKVSTNLQDCLHLIGEKNTFSLIYISYLYSNCLKQEPSAKVLEAILQFLTGDVAVVKKSMDSQLARKVFNHAFELSLDFRLQTTGFFCALSGIDIPLLKLFDFDILEILKTDSCVKDFLSLTQPFD